MTLVALPSTIDKLGIWNKNVRIVKPLIIHPSLCVRGQAVHNMFEQSCKTVSMAVKAELTRLGLLCSSGLCRYRKPSQ